MKKGIKRTKNSKKKMPKSRDIQPPVDDQGRISVLVEIQSRPGASSTLTTNGVRQMKIPGVQVDEEYEPIRLTSTDVSSGSPIETFLIRVTVGREDDIRMLEAQPEVVRVWRDTPIAPFTNSN